MLDDEINNILKKKVKCKFNNFRTKVQILQKAEQF